MLFSNYNNWHSVLKNAKLKNKKKILENNFSKYTFNFM